MSKERQAESECDLKNKANLFRIEYRVMRIAKRNLKKQSQFVADQISVSSLQRKDYENRARPGLRGNKAYQSQMPAFGRKLEARNPKS
jgi:hypothetical protein